MSRRIISTAPRRVTLAPPTTGSLGFMSRQLPYTPWVVARRGLASANDDDDTRGGGRSMAPRRHRSNLPSTRRMMSSPFDTMLEAFENDLNDMFPDRDLMPFAGRQSRGLVEWVPKVNVSETDSSIHVHAELPGVKKDDIRVDVDDDGNLVIKGERRQEKKEEDKDKRYTRVESSFGSFERRLRLPEGVARDQIKAKFADGVLEVDIPRPSPTARSASTINIE